MMNTLHSDANSLNDDLKAMLLAEAKKSIEYSLSHPNSRPIKTSDYPERLQQPGATFVTLNRHQQLRGCIGTLIAQQPLIDDLNRNAYQAAFKDPRFPPLTQEEYSSLSVQISLLTPPEKLSFDDEASLLDIIEPGIDGLILRDQANSGTFLPSVWEQLPDKVQFFKQLKAKAGLPAQHWSNTLECYRYRVDYWGDKEV